MTTIKIPRESEEHLETTITADDDPTANVLEFSFPARGSRPDVWTLGTWGGVATESGGTWTAIAETPVLGVGDLDLAPGTYQIYMRITSGDEAPVIKGDQLRVE